MGNNKPGESVFHFIPNEEGNVDIDHVAYDNEQTTRRIITKLAGLSFHPVELEELVADNVTLREGTTVTMLRMDATEAIIRFAVMSDYASESMFN